jgi:hypothetical protein
LSTRRIRAHFSAVGSAGSRFPWEERRVGIRAAIAGRPARHQHPRPLAASERAMLAKTPMGRQLLAEYAK